MRLNQVPGETIMFGMLIPMPSDTIPGKDESKLRYLLARIQHLDAMKAKDETLQLMAVGNMIPYYKTGILSFREIAVLRNEAYRMVSERVPRNPTQH